ncbi:MAG: Gfo/Idh/MocA family protein [Kiritimatiellia bacterium]|jgi:predicted dehydrogenase
MKTIRIGMVGYKFMGKAHSNAWQRLGMFFDSGAKIELKALCGRDADWVKESAETFGFGDVETDWEKLVRRDDVDVIDITAPSNVHKPIAIAAAQNGKHVFCEKPLALTVGDAREILDAVTRADVKHQVGFNYRFAPAIQLAKQLIDSGKLGTIYHFRAKYLQDWILDPSFPLVWRLDKSVAGSGSHGDLGAHLIDLAHFLVGDMKRVIGMSRTFVDKRPEVGVMQGLTAESSKTAVLKPVTVDDATLFLTEFDNGALGSFEATRFAAGHKNDMSFEVNGSKGSARFEFERMNELQYHDATDNPETSGFKTIQVTEGFHPYMKAWWPVGHVIGYEQTFVHEFHEFVQAIVNDGPTAPDFSDGVRCCQVLDAVDRSIADARWINVADV